MTFQRLVARRSLALPRALTRALARALALVVACAGGPALASTRRVVEDGPEWLAKSKAAALALVRLHAVVRVVDTAADGTASQRVVESFVDVKSGRARTEVREVKKALPSFIVCGGPEGVRFERLEVEEVAEQRSHLDLSTLLAASFAGELLATTFRGDIVSMKAGAYQKPTIISEDESVAGESCVHLRFGGNHEADLWIARKDQLPRRLKGTVAGRTLEETVTRLAADFADADAVLEIEPPEGARLLDAATAGRRWTTLPPESSRWPKVDEPAPDFEALDLQGQRHRLSEASDRNVVLAFWNVEDDASVALAAKVEKAFTERGDAAGRFIHVAALADRTPIAEAAGRVSLAQPVWIAGAHAKNAFRVFRIWTSPVFVRVEGGKMRPGITRDGDEARRWFAK